MPFPAFELPKVKKQILAGPTESIYRRLPLTLLLDGKPRDNLTQPLNTGIPMQSTPHRLLSTAGFHLTVVGLAETAQACQAKTFHGSTLRIVPLRRSGGFVEPAGEARGER